MKILYVLKKNLIYGGYNSVIARSGLLNSARLTSDQLRKHLHVHTHIEICHDANEINKFVHHFKPNVVIIEALWATPKKMEELGNLHKRIKFFVLIHSEVPFLAMEGNAIDWIKQYNEIPNVWPAFNSRITFEQFFSIGISGLYLPNVYSDVYIKEKQECRSDTINIASFGAIRPFKNQLIQAMAAIVYANKHGKKLHYHMNTSRTEQGGEGVLKNIVALFEGTRHKLIGHGWKDREGFLNLVARMDLGLQLSFSESFNIVCSDFVNENTPIVVSPTINWMPKSQMCSTEDIDEMIERMEYSIRNRKRVTEKCVRFLNRYNSRSLKEWAKVLFL